MPDNQNNLTNEQVLNLIEISARRAAQEAVIDTFRNLGIDPHNPEHIVQWHADRIWTRQAREGSSKLNIAAKMSIIGSIITAISFAIWQLIERGTPPS